MIYTLNTNGYLLYPVAKTSLKLSDREVYDMINSEFLTMVNRLDEKGVDYDKLKRALIPNQDKDNNEVCFVFDSNLTDSDWYGYKIFSKLIPLMDKKSTYSILAGDYIDISRRNDAEMQVYLHKALSEVIDVWNESTYKHSSQYFLVYINSITKNQIVDILRELKNEKWFYGYALLNSTSNFKTYLSYILTHICIKARDRIIVRHPVDYEDNENINMIGYPYEENGFKLVSINEDSYGPFLSYKIESFLPDKDDISFSLNALFPKFDSTEKLKLNISESKWQYLIGNTTGKGGIINSLDIDDKDKNRFAELIFRHICGNYVYNLRRNNYGDYLFNVCVELPTKSNKIRRTTIALKYYPDSGIIDIVTIT